MSDKSDDGILSTVAKAATFPLVMGVAGILLIIVALAGRISISTTSISVAAASLRVCSGALGAVLIVLATYLYLPDARRARARSETTPADAAQPAAPPEPGFVMRTVDTTGTPFDVLVENALQVDVLARTGVNLLQNYEKTFRELCRRGRVRLLFVDPSSDAARHVYADNYSLYKTNAAATLSHVDAIRRDAGAGRFQVRVTKHAPTMGLIRVDEGGSTPSFFQVQLYFVHAALARDRPVFRVSHPDGWYGVFLDEFEKLWGESSEWVE